MMEANNQIVKNSNKRWETKLERSPSPGHKGFSWKKDSCFWVQEFGCIVNLIKVILDLLLISPEGLGPVDSLKILDILLIFLNKWLSFLDKTVPKIILT